MEYLPHGLQLDIPKGCFPLTTDSMVLAHFAGDLGTRSVLDLGAGCGTLGLLLCARSRYCRVTGVELDEAAHHAAGENIRRNALDQRMESICADLRRVPGLFAPGHFECCISNPPYFSGGPAAGIPQARREDACTLAELMKAAAWALKFGGDFFLVHRPERLGQIIALVLLKLRKGAKPGLSMGEWGLRHPDGSPTSIYQEIYHIRED